MNLDSAIRSERNRALFYSLVLGTAIFIYVTGGAIINPTNRDWLMFGDTAQHYLGWEFFRHTPLLQWPIGANYPLGMELSSSIVFTDSIPVAAYIAKLFNPILPTTFQYFGMWIWLCFVLHAFFAQRFLKFFVSNRTHVYLGACFVVFSPPLIYRLVHAGYGHIALASHWLILASFCLYLRPGKNDAKWSILIALCWLIQAYFAPMIAAVWIASIAKRMFTDNERLSLAKSIGVVSISSFLVMWASGYFMIGSNFNPEGWNYVFRWEPLSFVDSGTEGSTGWSHILQDRAQTDGTTEAFSFLGVGVFAMMSIALARLAFVKFFQNQRTRLVIAGIALICTSLLVRLLYPTNFLSLSALMLVALFGLAALGQIVKNQQMFNLYAPLSFSVVCLAIYSLTNRVGFGQRTIFEFPLFPPLRQFTDTFRTHGRSIWPVYYLLVFAAIILFTKTFHKKYLTHAIVALLCFQVFDSAGAINSARLRFTDSPQWASPLMDPRWKKFAATYKNVVVIPPLNDDPDERWIVIDEFASSHQLGTNSGNFSRFSERVYSLTTKNLIASINTDSLDVNSLYIIEDNQIWRSAIQNLPHYRYAVVNGYKIIFPEN
jgi:hypothetical protein